MIAINASKFGKIIFIAVIMTASMLGIFISDIYVPSLPSISHDFHSSDSLLAFSVTLYFIVYASAQLIYGPLSERYGRRKIFLIGLIISTIGTVIAMTSQGIYQLMIGRCIQAIGMAGPMAIGRVMIRDVMPNRIAFARFSSVMSAGILLAPVIAPLLGAYLSNHFGWRADFIFILIMCLLALTLGYWYIVETLANPKKRISAKLSVQTYAWVIKQRGFYENTTIAGLVMGAIVAYLSLSPFMFQIEFGLTEMQYAGVFAFGDLFIVIGMLSNAVLLKYFDILKVQRFALRFFGVGALMLMLNYQFFGNHLEIVIISIVIFNYASGISFANSSALAMTSFTRRLGAVGSLFGCLQMLFAGIVAGLITILPLSPTTSLAYLLLICGVAIISLDATRKAVYH